MEHPFLFWNAHENLKYLQSTKRLNSQQARSALFFNWFNFQAWIKEFETRCPVQNVILGNHLSRRGLHNFLKMHSISGWMGSGGAGPPSPEPGHHPMRVPTGPSGFQGCRIVGRNEPNLQLLTLGYLGRTKNPGPGATAFWWPTMNHDVKEYVSACPICAHYKGSNKATTGLLTPLSTPSCPWSYISVDFATGLPSSEGNTTILTVIDRFSKMVHFNSTDKRPSAKETAELLLQQVVRLHGFPVDIVSNRGPQFVSQFWKFLFPYGSHCEPLIWLPPTVE